MSKNRKVFLSENAIPKKKCVLPNVKFIYSEKATSIGRNLQILFKITCQHQNSLEISSYFCGLLRIYELYYSVASKQVGDFFQF